MNILAYVDAKALHLLPILGVLSLIVSRAARKKYYYKYEVRRRCFLASLVALICGTGFIAILCAFVLIDFFPKLTSGPFTTSQIITGALLMVIYLALTMGNIAVAIRQYRRIPFARYGIRRRIF